MKKCIKRYIKTHSPSPKTKEWLWFIGLWMVGFLGVSVIAQNVKVIMKYQLPS